MARFWVKFWINPVVGTRGKLLNRSLLPIGIQVPEAECLICPSKVKDDEDNGSTRPILHASRDAAAVTNWFKDPQVCAVIPFAQESSTSRYYPLVDIFCKYGARQTTNDGI